jgi:transcription elongation factor GreA
MQPAPCAQTTVAAVGRATLHSDDIQSPNMGSATMLDELKDKLGEEIERLTHELQVTLPQAIQKAVEHGDLRENSEYKSALERQQFVQARLNHLTRRMGELSKVDLSEVPRDRVGFGSRVRVRDLRTKAEEEYTLVFGDYIDIDTGQISMASPLGQTLLGKVVGDEVGLKLPRGERLLQIIELTTLPEMVGDR